MTTKIMEINYCLPILKTNKTQVSEKLAAAKDYQYYEIWLDYIEDLDFDFVNQLITDYGNKLILVFRRQNLETPLMETQKRLSLISSLANKNCLIDLDVITQQEELSYVQSNSINVSLITSYHNYQQTPEDKKLIEVMSIMGNYKPEIIKIATKCINPKDGLRLLDLLLSLKQEKKKYIILGMGEYGTITRIYGTLWGNEIIFAPEKDEEATSPGQLTKEETKTVINILAKKQ
jgi:3-dehydroquinate dehydratase-1